MDDFYTGLMKPLDTDEYAEIRITVADGMITSAECECTDEVLLKDCCETVCRVITDKPAADVMQMNNNAVYYNCENELPRSSLYLATIAVAAAKKAVLDYFRKNGIEYKGDGVCSCLN